MGQELLWEGILVKGPSWQTLHFIRPKALLTDPTAAFRVWGTEAGVPSYPTVPSGGHLVPGTWQHSFHPGPGRDGAPLETGLSRSSLDLGFCGSSSLCCFCLLFCRPTFPSPCYALTQSIS